MTMIDEKAQQRRAELAAQIEGRSDEEISKGIEAQGIDAVLATAFEGMAAAFQPAKAVNQNTVIQYDVTAPDGTRSYQLTVASGTCTLAKGAPVAAKVTLTLSLPNFIRLIAGKLNGQLAFMTGKLKLSGDMGVAMVMQTWFPQS
jgi:putative sterol carrier protein